MGLSFLRLLLKFFAEKSFFGLILLSGVSSVAGIPVEPTWPEHDLFVYAYLTALKLQGRRFVNFFRY